MARDLEGRLDLSSRALLAILKNLPDHGRIGRSSLARMARIDAIISQLNLKESTASRGLALAMIIEDVIETQRRRSAEGTEDSIMWNFIASRYLSRHSLDQAAEALPVSKRTLARLQLRGLGLLASELVTIIKGGG